MFKKSKELTALFATRKARVIVISIVALAAVAVVLLFVFRPRPASAPLPVVAVSPVTVSDVNIYGEYAGRIRAQQFVEVRARVEGYLEKMFFEEGTHIDKGQTMFLIDRKVYKALAEKARAQLNKARANALKAERDLARIRPLYEQNAASQLDLDNAEAAYESAKAEESVAAADLTQAELVLSYTTVTSPISASDGGHQLFQLGNLADIGTLVGPGGKSLLATVVKSDTVLVDFSMTALDYLNSKNRDVNIGQKSESRQWEPYVTVTMADGSEYPFKGLVDFASPQVDPATGTFSVRAEMPNPDHVLLPGEFTRVKVLKDVRTDAIEVPAKALEIERGGAYVYVVRPDSVVERRFVETGPEAGNYRVIERGLSADELIVTEGFHKLRHGMKVQPVAAAADSTSTAQP